MSMFPATQGLRAIAGGGAAAPRIAKFLDFVSGVPLSELVRQTFKGGGAFRLNSRGIAAADAAGLERLQAERIVKRLAEQSKKDGVKVTPRMNAVFDSKAGRIEESYRPKRFDKDIAEQAEAMLFREHIVQAVPAAGLAAGLGVSPFSTRETTPALDAFMQAKAVSNQTMRQSMQTAKFDRLRQDMLRSAARLSAANPQLYEQVLAGRRLPMGATVLGGQPRVDLLQELALGMAQGQFKSSVDPSRAAALSQLVGGM